MWDGIAVCIAGPTDVTVCFGCGGCRSEESVDGVDVDKIGFGGEGVGVGVFGNKGINVFFGEVGVGVTGNV